MAASAAKINRVRFLTSSFCSKFLKFCYETSVVKNKQKKMNKNFIMKRLAIFMSPGIGIMIYLYCLEVQAGFYSDMVECRTLSSVDRVRSPVGA